MQHTTNNYNGTMLLRNELVSFISKFGLLINDEVEALADTIVVKQFKKGAVLVSEGNNWDKCYFVLKGCLRQYLIIDRIKKTTQFYTEE